MEWINKLKPGVHKNWLQLLAGVIWTGVGLYLIYLALGWIFQPGITSNWYYWLPGIILASLIYYFGFSKLARKNSRRIQELPVEKPCLFAFQEWHSYPLVLFMIGLGIGLRIYSPIPKPLLGIMYLGIGGGLGGASIHYYQAIIKNFFLIRDKGDY
jgi:hypothetical protein